MSKFQKKIKELKTLCEIYGLDLNIKWYDSREICIFGTREDEEEVFNISIWYRENRRLFYLNLDSAKENYKNNGCFSKEEVLLLLSLDDLTDEELEIKQQIKEIENNE